MDEKKIKIMLIEDNPGDVRLMHEMLKESGASQFHLEHADRLSSGLERLIRENFDIVLLDLGLPESQGIPTLEKTLALSLKAPIVVLTGSIADETIGIKAVQGGAQDYLTKGQLDSKSLVRSIRYAIERKRVEELLRKSESRLRTLIQTAPGVIIYLSPEGRILEFNPEAERVFGFKSEKVLGQNYFELFLADEMREGIAADMKKVLEGKPVRGYENPMKCADGSERFFIWNVDRIINEKEYPIGVIAIGQDITERRQFEEELRKQRDHLGHLTNQLAVANKELESFSYSVSHDLRAPLNRIIGFCDILLKDYAVKLDEQGKNYLHRVITASQHMVKLIRHMLDLARATRSEIHYEVVNLSALVKMIAKELREKQPERQVEFVIAEGLTVRGDPELLRMALENLLGNAWKFTGKHQHAKIEFGVAQHGGKSVYFLRDNGAGFKMDFANKLFNTFQRLHPASDFEGTGIGLATVQRIIQRHGGHIWAESTVDKGATFYFTL